MSALRDRLGLPTPPVEKRTLADRLAIQPVRDTRPEWLRRGLAKDTTGLALRGLS